MFRSVALIALAGCGRLGFEAVAGHDGDGGTGDGPIVDVPSDVVPLGHDEDGDGIRDVDDPCPHLAGDAADGDGDGVGDLCDPRSGTPGDAIAAFYTMGAGDQPFTVGVDDDGVWTQLPDALRFTGDQGADNNLFGHMSLSRALGSVRVGAAFDITQVFSVPTGVQNQIAIAVHDAPPTYVTEVNQVSGSFSVSSITHFDGTNFTSADSDTLDGGIHTGRLTTQSTHIVNTSVRFDTSWPGEAYTEQVNDTVYQGASLIDVYINNLHFDMRYLIIITSP